MSIHALLDHTDADSVHTVRLNLTIELCHVGCYEMAIRHMTLVHFNESVVLLQ